MSNDDQLSDRLLVTLNERWLNEDGSSKRENDVFLKKQDQLQHSWLEFEKQRVLQHLLRSAALQFPAFGQGLSLAETRSCQNIGNPHDGAKQPLVSARAESQQIAAVKDHIESVLQDQCTALGEWLCTDSGPVFPTQKVKGLLRERKHAVASLEQQLDKLHGEQLDLLLEKSTILAETIEHTLQLLTQHRLGTQNTSNKVAVSFIVSKAQALQLKLRVIELQIKGETYSGSRSTALREIRSQLDACTEQVRVQLAEKRQMLHHYSALGPSFNSLAAQYHSIRAEMENKRWALQELAKS